MPIDWDAIPDQGIDWDAIPDKGVDWNALPDQGVDWDALPDQGEPTGGTLKATAKAAVKVPLSVAATMALFPGAGIAALLPKISTDPDKLLDWGDAKEVQEKYEEVLSYPQKLITTPEEAKATEYIGWAMKPIEMAGEGWRLIAQTVEKFLGAEHPTLLQPIAGTIGEAAALFAIGGEGAKVIKSKGKLTIQGVSAKNIEKLRVAQESKYGRYGVLPEKELLIQGEPPSPKATLLGEPSFQHTAYPGLKTKPVQLYQVEGGPHHGNTFSATRLKELGIEISDIPSPQKAATKLNRKVPEVERNGMKVMDMIGKRRAEIDKGILDSEIFIKQFEREFSARELEAVPFIRQGIKDPSILKEIGKEELIPTIQNPPPELARATGKIGVYYDKAYKFLQENWGDVGFVENYVTQLWDIPKGRKSEVINYFVTHNPFTKKRKIPTLEEGIKLGLTPKTTNIAELLRVYDQFKVKAVANVNFVKGLKDLVGPDGEPLIMASKKAPEGWVMVDHPTIRYEKIHPSIAKEVKIIFDQPFSHPAINALETVNAFAKKGMLSLSFFHHHALTESAFSTGIGRKALKQWNPFKIVRELRNKNYEVFRNQELAKDAIDHGVTFGALEDVQRHRVAKTLESLERVARNVPAAKQLTKGIRKGNELWDAALWDYYHNSLKLWAYEKNVFDALKYARKKTPFLKEEDFVFHGSSIRGLKEIKPESYFAMSPKEAKTWISGIPTERNKGSVYAVGKTTIKDVTAGKAEFGAAFIEKGLARKSGILHEEVYEIPAGDIGLKTFNIKDYLPEARRELLPKEVTVIKKEMGRFVNDSFGGQNWDLNKVLGNPKVRQMLHWALLAPDWTFSTLKQAAAPAKGLYLQAKAKNAPTAAAFIQKRLAGKALTRQGAMFWARAAIYFNLIAQSVNFYMTKKHYGDGRFTWENAPGQPLNIFIGFNEDGTERYLRMGKQFREVLEWGLHPIKKVGAKLSPVVREVGRQLTAHDPGSGYPTEWAEKEGIYTIPERIKSVLEMPIPFSIRPYVESRPGAFMFTFPTSKGMTNWKAVDLFKKAIKDKNINKIKRVYISSLENNLDAEQLFKSAKSSVKADITFDNKRIAKEIFNEIKDFDNQAKKDALELYKNRGILKPRILLEVIKLLRKHRSIQQQKERLKQARK